MTAHRSDQHWTEQHGELVRSATAEVPQLTEPQRIALWRQIETAAAAAPRDRPRRWRVAFAGIAAVLAIGVVGGATAATISSHTGRGPVDREDERLGGPGERLDPAGDDFPATLDEVSSDIVFPSAQARARALAWEVADAQASVPAQVSTGALRLWMSGHALCSWTDTWAGARRTGDTSTEQEAAAVILSARQWTSITDTDPRMSGGSEFAWLPDLESAVESGDPTAARRALASNGSCLPGLAPELGMSEPQ